MVTFHLHCMENFGRGPAILDAPLSTHAPRQPSVPPRRGRAREGVAVREELPTVPHPLPDPGAVARGVGVLARSTALGERWGFLNVGAFVLERNF